MKKVRTGSVSKFVDKVLRAQIENVSAYIRTEKALNLPVGSSDDLMDAEIHLKNLEQLFLIPEKEWIGRFFDTRGYFNYAKAKSLPQDRKQEKRALLESAAQDVAQSLVKDTTGPDLDIRREHQDAIDQELALILNGEG